jgi:hypothetical protein
MDDSWAPTAPNKIEVKNLPTTPEGWLRNYPAPHGVLQHLFEGNKIRAIKAYREAYRILPPTKDPNERPVLVIGLRDAKLAVEHLIDLLAPYTVRLEQCSHCSGFGHVRQRVLEKMSHTPPLVQKEHQQQIDPRWHVRLGEDDEEVPF